MRGEGKTLAEINLALGFAGASHVGKALRRHIDRRVGPVADEYIAMQLDTMDRLKREVFRVMEATHYRVSDGRVVYHAECACTPGMYGEGEHCPHWKPLRDTSPVLAAADRLIKVEERISKLLGLDKPVKHDVSVSNVTVKVEGADDV